MNITFSMAFKKLSGERETEGGREERMGGREGDTERRGEHLQSSTWLCIHWLFLIAPPCTRESL